MPKSKITSINRKPTHSELSRHYEEYLWMIHNARQMGNHDRVVELLDGISEWCWAHRDNNGSLSDQQVKRNVNRTFWKVFANRWTLNF